MRARRPPRSRLLIPALVACFYAGIAVGWLLRALPAPTPASRVVDGQQDEIRLTADPTSEIRLKPDPTSAGSRSAGATASGPPSETRLKPDLTSERSTPETGEASSELTIHADPVAELRHRHLRLPIDRAKVDAMEGQFADRRAGGTRGHEAVDILADRNTPIRAVEDGEIAKLFLSKAGGITIYQFDPTGRFCYYYAHLESYANGLKEGQHVSAGDTIGYVGTSGNAPKNTPHLHFAIFELTPELHWWQGRPVDPFLVFRR